MTVTHIDERIADLLLGDVSDGERESLEAHVANCALCATELMHAADAFAALALALPAEAPPPSLRVRILDDARPPRLWAMVDKVAALFDVTKAKAREFLDKVDGTEGWMDGPVPNSWVMLVEGCGEKLRGAFCTFVKMGPGVKWPAHRHLGREYMLVLDGGFTQHDGVEVHPGDLHVMEEGSAHAFTIFPDETCIAAGVVHGGLAFGDDTLESSDPQK